ncbi:MAG: hypothetical protein H6937_10705 [Burkholderiales bacterium]|nr:hypothetical protein [Burkholderiales bacterium]MDR4516293.1 hypothetical protein [Nitrosomonas sp.]
MRIIVCLLILIFSMPIHATIIQGFTGAYSASQWTMTTGGGDITVNSSSENSLTFDITNRAIPNPIDTYLEYETVAASSGMVSFDMIMGLIFRPLDTFSPILTFFSISDGVSNIEASISADGNTMRHIDLMVDAGQTFGFRVEALGVQQDVLLGTTISNFSAPVQPIKEPGIFFLIIIGLLALSGFSRRTLS